MFKKLHSLLLTFLTLLAFFAVSCYKDKGTQFELAKPGLTPGSNTTELNLAWYSDTNGTKSFVRLFNATGTKLIKTVEGTTGSASGKQWHKAVLTGLTPGTSYKYSVSSDSAGWSEEYDYSVPAAGAFKFAVVGDPQLNTDSTIAKGWEEIVGKIAASGASFIVSTGDQVDDIAGNESEYANFFAPAQMRRLPFAPVAGNHDAHCLFVYHYNLPNEQNMQTICTGPSTINNVGNYYYLYNNVLFVALNTSAYPSSKEAAEPYINAFRNTIEAAKAANAGKYDWIVVHHHKSTQSIAGHVADTDIQYYVEAGFERLMTQYGVDLVIAGHDHIYVRSFFMKQDSTDEFSVKSEDGKGTVYLTVTTASGLKFYPPFVANVPNVNYPYLLDGNKGSVLFSKDNPILSLNIYSQNQIPEYTLVEVGGKTMTIRTYGLNNAVVDTFTLVTYPQP
jgi:hypothetical protein